MRTRAAVLLALTVLASLLAAPGAPAQASKPNRQGVAHRDAVFSVVNSNETSVACLPDRKTHQVHARLVGPRRIVAGHAGVVTVNVLVHDAGTGGWFWNLRSDPAYDYATQLAKKGQTSLVVDRLGYDISRLKDGDGTCLGAQATMLHQVVQELYAGQYRFTDGGTVVNASHVVVQGHGTGATIAQIEAASFDDVQGVVLMSQPSSSPTSAALSTTRAQLATCRSHGYAPFGAKAADYRRLLFHDAAPAVVKAAVQHRNATPCGDVNSLAAAVLTATLGAGDVTVPVLQIAGTNDPRRSSTAGTSYRSSASVTTKVVQGAGSALVLERSAPRTRAMVLAWLRTLKGF